MGVDLFFVLSGFLVSGLLFTEYQARGRLGIGRFYVRRGWKIYPPFFALIAATLGLILLLGRPIPTIPLASEVFFLQSYVPGLWKHTWSLAVEEHFYILLPLTLALIIRWNRASSTPLRPVLTVALVVCVVSLVLRLVNWYLRPNYGHYTHLVASHLRFDSLLFGVAISYAYHFHSDRFLRLFAPRRKALILVGAILLAPAFVLHLETTPFIYTFGLTVFYVGSGMMLVGTLLSPISIHRSVTLSAALGAYSYSIYLWHLPVLFWGIPLLEIALGVRLDFATTLAIYFGGSICFGVAMAKCVEVPALRLRDRWFPSRSPGAVEVEPNQQPQQTQPNPTGT
ncbi:MAG: acyltransferase [Lysobacterales bacterium]|nr:acyltransferase [Rhodanobacteraceae bacterium]